MRKEVKEIIVKDDQNFTEMLRLELPITVEEFQDALMADDAVFGYVDLLKYRSNFDFFDWVLENEILGNEKWRDVEGDSKLGIGERIRSVVYESWMRSGPIRAKRRISLRQKSYLLDGVRD